MENKIIQSVEEVTARFPELYGESSDYQKNRYTKLIERFSSIYGKPGYMASASGRVEVCGNHTDHNGGQVVACTINLDTLGMFIPSSDGCIEIKSEGYPDLSVKIDGSDNVEKGTSKALVAGICQGLKDRGFKVGGFKACFTSNVVSGAGISSSASYELLVCEILNFLYNEEKMSKAEKAEVSQFAENVFFGKPCGLLDQSAISYGGVVKLDFKDKKQISCETIDNSLKDYTLILIDTGGSHADLTDEYASIPKEMREVATLLGVERLCDVSKEYFLSRMNMIKENASGRAILRAIHFYSENERVKNVAQALKDNDYNLFLKSVTDSGDSSWKCLQNCYVSGDKEQRIPLAVAISKSMYNKGASRVHGGGFGGTILNIIPNEIAKNFIEKMSEIYGESKVIPLKVRSVGAIVL